MKEVYSQEQTESGTAKLPSKLLIATSIDGKARGAGYARNRAIQMHPDEKLSCSNATRFLCLLDSDDIMHRHRIAEQTNYMMNITDPEGMGRTLLGCQFVRDPPDSTWHYSQWANSLSDERLMLERYREVTILQPTWFLCRSRWTSLGGYVEAPVSGSVAELVAKEEQKNRHRRLIHEKHESLITLRLAEDLRFFHEHLWAHGILRLHRAATSFVTYRHNGQSQSYRTSRKLLLHLRVLAFSRAVLKSNPQWQQDSGHFVIWGAGRDGKDFVKSLDPEMRNRIYCFVDIDSKKLDTGNYMNREMNLNIPIVHFSYLAKDNKVRKQLQNEWEDDTTNGDIYGRIDKSKKSADLKHTPDDSIQPRNIKRRRITKIPELDISRLSQSKLQELPVVVCVAMYRTNGVLEKNVNAIGRTEGEDLWHFS